MPGDHLLVGLMSGTSLDGIDAALVRVRGSGSSTRFTLLASLARPFPPALRSLLVRNSVPATSRVDEITRAHMLLARLYALAVRDVAKKGGIRMEDLTAIGSHGQTIHHLPGAGRIGGYDVRSTLQIGSPSALAVLTGVPTVGDFRIADMAAGGEGAPLVPYVDWMLFRSPTKNRILLNIGGIANITILPAGCDVTEVRAFDTGPGNIVIDALMRRFFRRPYDREGATAGHGMVIIPLIHRLLHHPYLRRRPPKSTGREMFGDNFVDALLANARGYAPADVVATATAFTVLAVRDACRRFAGKRFRVDEVIVSGGGARNATIIADLKHFLAPARVHRVDDLGMPGDMKEAICFALLANETLCGRPANIPGVTGARKEVLLGTVSYPDRKGIIRAGRLFRKS